ncbi:MAG: hypothetical protein WD873_04620, partial [Candidatus Hydrogenedentales bacterium]
LPVAPVGAWQGSGPVAGHMGLEYIVGERQGFANQCRPVNGLGPFRKWDKKGKKPAAKFRIKLTGFDR